MRLKTMMALDARYVTLVENTYYQILPPETTSLPAPTPLTPMQQFINKTISEVNITSCLFSQMDVCMLINLVKG